MPDLTCLSPSCLQRAAADPDAPPDVRVRLSEMARIAAHLTDQPGTANKTERSGTELNPDGHA